MNPKVFISYSWSNSSHQQNIEVIAKRLINDGVDVVIDIWDLREGYDKFAFMERMVVDKSITHVLVFSDEQYAKKADARKSGVGTESQIISHEIYEKVNQSKIIPIVCQFSSEGKPFLPTYLQSLIWIDFSNSQKIEENWQNLIRLLYEKPFRVKPKLGLPPSYLSNQENHHNIPSISLEDTTIDSIIDDIKKVGFDSVVGCQSRGISLEYAEILKLFPDVRSFVSDIYNLVRYNDWANYAYDKGDDEALESNETAISDLRTKLRKRIKDTLIEMSKNNSIIIKSSSL